METKGIGGYEKVQFDGASIFSKASEESSSWLTLQLMPQEAVCSIIPSVKHWQKPPINFVKCNMATSWMKGNENFGATWLVRDSQGIPVFHSRRAFAPRGASMEAELMSIRWVLEAMHDLRIRKIIVETSSDTLWEAITCPHNFPHLTVELSRIIRALYQFDQCHIELVSAGTNDIAVEIATSVTKDRRYQSYIANGGPGWLSSSIRDSEPRWEVVVRTRNFPLSSP
ncbi:uncharacterized protein LOC106442103 [Brassica napus]|uniref:uncharacterized protein LOC106442103 n=1 Tax=Brassica napus TaxID=3708 RepID=UPI0006AB20CA|nr:uncharacterized protein LOC106442103 [Brassica napus]